jgi:hypothetical protein
MRKVELSSSDHPWITTGDAAGQAQAISGVTRKPLSCCMNLALSGTILIYPPAPPPAPGTRRVWIGVQAWAMS